MILADARAEPKRTMNTMDMGLSLEFSAASLENLYSKYNRREFVHPDPLEFLYCYDSSSDREIVGMVASSLAYGRVTQILRSVSLVLERMGPRPSRFLSDTPGEVLERTFRDFKHRFTTGRELAALLIGMKRAVDRHGSLETCFACGLKESDATVLPALGRFAEELAGGTHHPCNMFLPSPAKGSACKRLNLFLRWMVRCDCVDPGGWDRISPSRLIVPLDVHMHRIALKLELTKRRQADMRTALEVTEAFKTIHPLDPVRYDFSLTRLGIRQILDRSDFTH